MQDVQSRPDDRGISIQQVGVNGVHLPFLIKTKSGGFQQVLAEIRFTVSLPQEFKGTHMSRFMEILLPWSEKPLAESEMQSMLQEALDRLEAHSASLRLAFKYFVRREAPVSRRRSVLDLECFFEGTMTRERPMEFRLGVEVPFTSLCPCSKEISAYGAHNQRSVSRIVLQFHDGYECILIEDLAELAENQASSPIYPLLKREDEQYVTEHAYENPKFVEDILRDTVLALRELPGLAYFSVTCENFESIHHHNAFASHEEALGM